MIEPNSSHNLESLFLILHSLQLQIQPFQFEQTAKNCKHRHLTYANLRFCQASTLYES